MVDDSDRSAPSAEGENVASSVAGERPNEEQQPPGEGPNAPGQNASSGVKRDANGEAEGPDNETFASQEEYDERTAETSDVVVPDGEQRFRVRQMPPLKFAAIVEEYGIGDLAGDLQQVPEDATMDDDDLDEALAMVNFYRDVVIPNILRPRNAHWSAPPTDPDAEEVFDLSTLTEDDLIAIVAEITDQDAEEMIADGKRRARAENRGQPENQRFRG